MMRLSTSRPMSSVPNGCAQLGGGSRISGWGASGAYGEMTSAKIAVSTRARVSNADAMPSGLRLSVTRSAAQRLTSLLDCASKSETWARAMAMREPSFSARADAARSRVPDPRIEPCVGQIHQEVQRDEGRRDQHDVGLHHGIVAEQDGLDGEAAHSGQREDRLDDNRAGEQRAELPPHDRVHGNQRVLQSLL